MKNKKEQKIAIIGAGSNVWKQSIAHLISQTATPTILPIDLTLDKHTKEYMDRTKEMQKVDVFQLLKIPKEYFD